MSREKEFKSIWRQKSPVGGGLLSRLMEQSQFLRTEDSGSLLFYCLSKAIVQQLSTLANSHQAQLLLISFDRFLIVVNRVVSTFLGQVFIISTIFKSISEAVPSQIVNLFPKVWHSRLLDSLALRLLRPVSSAFF